MELEGTRHVMDALRSSHIDGITKEALIQAFRDDGISDLEGIAEHMLKRIERDLDRQKAEPRLIDFSPLAARTPDSVARAIVHAVPSVPLIFDGITYDPEDIHRFDGQALIFVPITASDGTNWLQLFPEEIATVLAGYFQTRQLAYLVNPADFSITPLPDPPPGPGDPPPPVYCHGSSNGIICGSGPGGGGGGNPPLPPPITANQVEMFDDADYTGNWFWLGRGYMYKDLTAVGRGGFFGGDWNDSISSLSSTNTSCIYCEYPNLQGSKLYLGPNKPISNLSTYAWNDRISSVWNFDSV